MMQTGKTMPSAPAPDAGAGIAAANPLDMEVIMQSQGSTRPIHYPTSAELAAGKSPRPTPVEATVPVTAPAEKKLSLEESGIAGPSGYTTTPLPKPRPTAGGVEPRAKTPKLTLIAPERTPTVAEEVSPRATEVVSLRAAEVTGTEFEARALNPSSQDTISG